jgi:hypothetical protein
MSSSQTYCATGSTLDDLTLSAWRYDTTANQYVFNWQSPKKAGSCYSVNVGLTDSHVISALFQLK